MPYRPVRYSTLLHCRDALRFWNASGRRSRSAGQTCSSFTQSSGLGRAEAQQECEQLDYYRARLQALQQTAEHAARRQAGLPRKLGLAAGMAMALLLI